MSKKLVACVMGGVLLLVASTAMRDPASGASTAPTPYASSAAASQPVPIGRGTTLATIRARGNLRCGSGVGLPGFGERDAQGRWSGFDIDFCRALATAIFGEPSKVEFVPLTAKDRLGALHRGVVDVLSRNTTWTLTREVGSELLFAGTTYYDGQGFLVHRAAGITDAANLPSGSVCVQQDTTTELNLVDFYRGRGLKYEAKTFATADEVEHAYAMGQCAAYTTDASELFVRRAAMSDPENHLILPQIISKEPLGPAVRQGDDSWFLIVRWTVMALVDAEELGVTQANVDAMAKGDNPRIKRLLGIEGNAGQQLGLSPDWAYRIIKFVGNYNDIFQRNLGDGSKLKIRRGLNDLWTRGGLLYAAPIQ